MTGSWRPMCYHMLWEGMRMKRLWKDILISLFMGLLLPGILLNAFLMLLHREPVREVAVV